MHSSANTARFAIIALLSLLTGAMGTATATAGTDFTSRDGSPDQHAMLARGSAGLDGMAFVRPVLKGVDDDEMPNPADLNDLRYRPGGGSHPVVWCAHRQDDIGHRRYYSHN